MNTAIHSISVLIGLPVVAGILLFIVPEKFRVAKGVLALLVSSIVLFFGFQLYFTGPDSVRISLLELEILNGLNNTGFSDVISGFTSLNADNLARLIVLMVCAFSFLILVYSIFYITKERAVKNYYPFILLTLGVSVCAVLADGLILFIFCWGFLGLTLYKLIRGFDDESAAAAKKTFILIGASDSIMILGIGIVWKIAGTLNISEISLGTTDAIRIAAFLALLTGSFTKAGAFPFHTWVPDYTKWAPASSSAYLPASLDKLLGIYFLSRICNDLFILSNGIRLALLIIGVMTIIIAVMMALMQHNYKRLLGFHAVSQVGYMIVGFGLGSLIGIAAGLFHMINNAIYKSGLLLSAGCVEYRTGKEELDDLGGLSKAMPVTFIASLIFALSISGVPPLNGFASKWMIYQGIIDFGKGSGIASQLWMVWLGLAVLGSALTLASFIKYIGGIFLGRKKDEFTGIHEVPALMYLPMLFLAIACIAFGVFATHFIVPRLFMPVTGNFEFLGIWNSSFITVLILVSIGLGILLYWTGNLKKFRREDSFIGGESMNDTISFSTTEFYKTISDAGFFSWVYQKAENKWFDLYDLLKRLTLWFSNLLSKAHTGVLPDYSIWVSVGLILMLILMIQS
ncbi:MAG: mrpA 2 [Bacteroidetes bacterium]|nr:mrpA 2 [Bacteroidota bacterium]